MDRESFLEVLKTQYGEDIREAHLECEHANTVDFSALNSKLKKLMASAKVEGISPVEFEYLVKSNLPDTIASKIDLHSDLAVPA